MEVAINNELKGKDFSQVQELFIDGTVHNNVDNTYLSDETKRLLEQCVELESLSIVNWRLASLKNFPHLPKLKKLVLSNNSLRDGLHHLLEAKLNLFFLNLTHNLISKVSELICLGFFNNLQSLELMGCGVCKAPDFTTMLFRIIPSLKTLDCVYMPNGETDDSDPFNINPHSNNNNHRHTANNNGINGTARPPPQHGKLYNMGQLLKDYNENFASLYYSYSSSNSYGPQELSASDLEQMLSDIHPGGIPQAPPPPSSPKVQEVPGTPPRGRPAAETESTDDEEEHSYDEDHDEDLETLQRIADQMLRKERPTRRAAEPQSRAAYTAYQAQLSQLDDEDEEDEDDDDFRPGEEGSDHSGQSSDDEPAQEERDAPEEASNESEEEDEDEEEEEERGSPSATSQTSGTSSGSKRGRESHEEEAETTQPKKQR